MDIKLNLDKQPPEVILFGTVGEFDILAEGAGLKVAPPLSAAEDLNSLGEMMSNSPTDPNASEEDLNFCSAVTNIMDGSSDYRVRPTPPGTEGVDRRSNRCLPLSLEELQLALLAISRAAAHYEKSEMFGLADAAAHLAEDLGLKAAPVLNPSSC